MRINRLQLKNFKRFTDLTIDLSLLHAPPKLVLMIGANGSGKSSVFDAFEWLATIAKGDWKYDETYHPKRAELLIQVIAEFDNGTFLNRERLGHDHNKASGETARHNLFYGRSALRQVPRLTRTSLGNSPNLEMDQDRPYSFIDRDLRFENDANEVFNRIVSEIFHANDFNARELREKYVAPLNQALQRIFGENSATTPILMALIPPGNDKVADIRFKKGNCDFHYNLLSSGEKEIINILLNLFIRTPFYQSTIYFIDELDVHLNTSLQYALLKEVTENWIPEDCQLWTASHSLGFIQYAKEAEHAAIIDFDQHDFDHPRTLMPEPKQSLDIYEVAVPKEVALEIFRDKQVVLCENKNDEYFNLLKLPNKLFVGVQNKDEVCRSIKNNARFYGVIDRDYLTDNEIKKIRNRYPNLFVLEFYAFENYLYHPDNILELISEFDAAAYRNEIVRQKNELRDSILLNLKQSRSYRILKDENIEDKTLDSILAALKSDEFNEFYPLFDMKGKFDRSSLAKLNLAKNRLVRTTWFAQAISRVFDDITPSLPDKEN